MTKVILPKWVYKNLEQYGNCALPNVAMTYERSSLQNHLKLKMKSDISIRTAQFPVFDKNHKVIGYAPYLIAEVK